MKLSESINENLSKLQHNSLKKLELKSSNEFKKSIPNLNTQSTTELNSVFY